MGALDAVHPVVVAAGRTALAADLERAVVQRDVERVAVDAGEVEREEVGVVGLGDVGAGPPRRGAVVAGGVVEDAVELAAEHGEVASGKSGGHGR